VAQAGQRERPVAGHLHVDELEVKDCGLRLQVRQAADATQSHHKRLTVCLCHQEAASVSGMPEGCQERLNVVGVVMDRRVGLAEAEA
jgi:hypothetical protein